MSSCTQKRLLAATAGAIASGLLVLPSQAFAQAGLSHPQTVAVLDFTVPPVDNDLILSRQATDSFALELQRIGNYEVIPRNQVEKTIAELGLTSPLTRSQLLRLGQLLGAENIVIGRLERLTPQGRPGRLQASLRILFFDVATGAFSNGTRALGSAVSPSVAGSLPDSDRSQKVMFSAVADAAFSAVRSLVRYQLPEATVLQTSGDTIWLNGGVRTGIRPGQEFIILRLGQQVGRVRVTDVSSQDARASLIDSGRGIRPEDRARLVIDPNDLPGTP